MEETQHVITNAGLSLFKGMGGEEWEFYLTSESN